MAQAVASAGKREGIIADIRCHIVGGGKIILLLSLRHIGGVDEELQLAVLCHSGEGVVIVGASTARHLGVVLGVDPEEILVGIVIFDRVLVGFIRKADVINILGNRCYFFGIARIFVGVDVQHRFRAVNDRVICRIDAVAGGVDGVRAATHGHGTALVALGGNVAVGRFDAVTARGDQRG